jgi:RHS repeat-associated protein
MSLGGAETLMNWVAGNVYRPFVGETFGELRGPGSNDPSGYWLYTDTSGRRFFFERIEALEDKSLWFLARIVDTVGNRVELQYSVLRDTVAPGPVELRLARISYSHLATPDDCPKYRIALDYAPFNNNEVVLGYHLDRGHIRLQRRLLAQISVLAYASCNGSTESTLRSYHFEYSSDADTGRPRLSRVDVRGRDGLGTLPVMQLEYGSALTNGKYQYKSTSAIAIPAGTPSIGHLLVSGSGGEEKFETTSAWVDFTGDGRPDFVRPANYDSAGTLSHYRNQPTGELIPVSGSIGQLDNLAEQSRRELEDWANGALRSAAIESWREMIDWNGDGRIDIVQARGAIDKDHWLVLLNFPAAGGGVQFVGRQVRTSALRVALKIRGHKGIEDGEPLPLSRSRTIGEFHRRDCVDVALSDGLVTPCAEEWCSYNPGEPCEDEVGPYWNHASKTVTEWKLQDLNGDGFPDFVFNSNPLIETTSTGGGDASNFCVETADIGEHHDVLECWGGAWTRSQTWTLDVGSGNRIRVFYNINGAGLANPTSSTEFAPENVAIVADDCGVERWSASDRFGSEEIERAWFYRTMTCGFREVNGDRLVDRVTGSLRAVLNTGAVFGDGPVVELPGRIGQASGREATCGEDSDDTDKYQVRSSSDLADLTGDGIPDFVWWNRRPPQQWSLHIGTGVGFSEPRPLESLSGRFEMSLVEETCKQRHSRTISGLLDFDGDGYPDVVKPTADGSLQVARIGAGNGALSAGRLTVVRNGYGSAVQITYANAKTDRKTVHDVPFPEVVVTRTQVLDERDPSRSFDPAYFAFGEARLHYDPLFARWTFPGYARRVTVTGIASQGHRSVNGTATIDRYLQPADLQAGLERHALLGRLKKRHLLVGNFIDAWAVSDLLLTTSWLQGETTVRQTALNTNFDNMIPADDCGDIDPISFQMGEPALCRASMIVSPTSTRSWRGASPPPSVRAVESALQVTSVDDFGRATEIRNFGDTARSDDDVCVQLSYATPTNTGLLGVLDAVSSSRVTDCASRRVLKGERYRYDNLAEGAVGRGLITSIVVERYIPATGASLGDVNAGEFSYDSFGNVAKVELTRSDDGVSRQTISEYDPFGIAPVRIVETASDVGVELPLVLTRDPVSLELWFIENGNGNTLSLRHDAFGRPTITTLRNSEDGIEHMLGETIHQGDDPADPKGRRVIQRNFDAWIAVAGYTGQETGIRETTAFFDSFGRVKWFETPLGADYGTTLVEGHRIHDGLGRPRFEAEPHVKGDPSPYGTSFLYNRDGSLRCSISGIGYQTTALPDASIARYPTCFEYLFADHQTVVRARRPSDLYPSAHPGSFHETRSTATGQILSNGRFAQNQGRLEFTRYGYDQLGQLTRISRLKNPLGGFPIFVSWTLSKDSIGRTLTTTEPASPPVETQFDDWGSPIATTWVDGTGSPAVERGVRYRYDGFGRLLSGEFVKDGVIDQSFSRYEFHYDLKSGDPVQVDARNLVGKLAWVSDIGGDGNEERRTYFGYDALGVTNLAIYRDTLEVQTYVQRQAASPLGDPLEVILEIPGLPGPEVVSYGRDSAGRIRQVTWKNPERSQLMFNATDIDDFGRYRSIVLGNGVVESHAFRPDRRRELLSTTVTGPSFTREREYAGYDENGRLRWTREFCVGLPFCTGADVFTTFQYDALDRLERARTASQHVTTAELVYSYDALGNLKLIEDLVSPTNTRSIVAALDDPDRICRTEDPNDPESGCSFSYDALGNVARAPDSARDIRSFEYDPLSRLVQMDKAGIFTRLWYDAFGNVNRIDQVLSPTTDVRQVRRYGPLIAKSRSGPLDVVERRVPGPLGTIAVLRNTGLGPIAEYFHPDPTANRSFTGDGGIETQAVRYDAFGSVLENSGVESDSNYVNELWNGGDNYRGFGVTHLGARFYDPWIGRFLQRDPIIAAGTSNRAHPYAFALNDPINFIDPTGFQSESVPTTEVPDFEAGVPDFEGSWWDGLWGGLASGLGAGLSDLYIGELDPGDPPRLFYPRVDQGTPEDGWSLTETLSSAQDWFDSLVDLSPEDEARFQRQVAARDRSLRPHPVRSLYDGILAEVPSVAASTYLGGAGGGAGRGAFRATAKGLAGPVRGSIVGVGAAGARAIKPILPTPKVGNQKLQNIINDLYKGTTNPKRIGSGTTADAIRHELATGKAVGGRFHLQKGVEYSRALENWLRNNPGALYRDRVVARSILDELRALLGGGP